MNFPNNPQQAPKIPELPLQEVLVASIEAPITLVQKEVANKLLEDRGNLQPYLDYIDRRMKEISVKGDSQEISQMKHFAFMTELPKILFAAGLIEEANDKYNDALDMAEYTSVEAVKDMLKKYLASVDKREKEDDDTRAAEQI